MRAASERLSGIFSSLNQGENVRKIVCITLLLASAGHAQNLIQSESSKERESAQYVTSTPVHKWATGVIHWFYNPAMQPTNVTTSDVVDAINRAAARWSAMCTVLFIYEGTTTASPYMGNTSSFVDRLNVVGWEVSTSAADTVRSNSWYTNAGSNVDVDVALNRLRTWTKDDLDGAVTSGLGFMLGLSSSNVNASVMATNLSREVAYNRTLRGDDVDGCASLYGLASTSESDRALNWAEATYPQLLKPSPASSGNYNGYYYRYYAGTNSYVGTKDGSAFFMGPDGTIQNLGTLESYKSQVRKAGY